MGHPKRLKTDSTHSLPACLLRTFSGKMANEGCNNKFYIAGVRRAIEAATATNEFF